MKRIALFLLAAVLFKLPALAAVTVTSPAAGSTVTSPVHYVATATTSTCAKGVASIGVYVDNKLIYVVKAKTLNTEISMALGAEHTVVEEWDKCGGASVATVNLTVAGPKPTVSISASPSSVKAGASSVVKVTATNATKVTLTGVDGSSYTLASKGGSETVKPAASTTYTATAVGASSTVTAKTTVTVIGASPTVSINANPTSITAGSASSLTVVAANATKVTVGGSDGTSYSLASTGGTQSVSPKATTIYTASAVGQSSTVTAKTTVTVTAAQTPTVAINAVPPSIVSGGSSELTVVATNATSVTLKDSNGNSYPMNATGGSASVSPTSTTTYTATAVGATPSVSVQASATVTIGAKAISSIAVTPNSATFALGTTQQFTATATYNDSSTADISSTADWSIANLAVATIDSSGMATSVASGSTSVSATLSGVSGSTPFTVTIAPGTEVNVPTWHGDSFRSGLNSSELSLTTTNVSSQTFGKLFTYLVNGFAYAQPVLESNVTINGSTHNVVYVATESNDVYAFDADYYGTGAPLWHVNVMQSGETADRPGSSSTLQPTIGITSTPVIDMNTGTLYVVSKQTSSSGNSFWRLNALDITTGAQMLGGPVKISASVPATNSASSGGIQTLTSSCIQRSALLEAYGNIYFGFGSCPTGWLLSYNATTLTQTGVFNASPNLDGEGTYASAGGVWMGGGGAASNGDGHVYITTGNGPYDGKTAWSDSILQLDPNTLAVDGNFTPQYYQYMDCADGDLASGGLLLIPGSSPPMALAGAKTGWMYLANTANLGGEQANDAGALDTLMFESDLVSWKSKTCTDATANTIQWNPYEVYGTAAYFNGSVYLGVTGYDESVPAGVRQFTLSGTTLTPSTYTAYATEQNIRGTTPFVSANGNSDGVLWIIDQGQPLGTSSPSTATLRAFDATNLNTELYDSNMNSGDAPGYGIKFASPIVVNGKVYIATGHTLTSASNPQSEIDVYGLN